MKWRAHLGGASWKVYGICLDGKCPDDDHEPYGSSCINIFSRCGREGTGVLCDKLHNAIVWFHALSFEQTDRHGWIHYLTASFVCRWLLIPMTTSANNGSRWSVGVFKSVFFPCRRRNVHLVDHNKFYVFVMYLKPTTNMFCQFLSFWTW